MYKYFKISIVVLLTCLFYACDVLDVETYDAIPADEVLTNKKGLDGAIIGAYNALQRPSIACDAIIFADLAADNLISRGSKAQYREVSANTIQASNTYVEAIWNRSYEGINMVNNIIEGIDGVTGITDQEKESYLGQCYFLRAFHYFNLVRYFGSLPLRTFPVKDASPESLNIPLSTEYEVFQQIISDLLQSENFLAGMGKGNSAFANEGATKGLLAKVYLYIKNWSGAATKADEVIDMGYVLELAEYSLIFEENINNGEIIFQIDFANSQDASNIMNDWLTPNGRFEVAVWKDASRTETVSDDFESNDLRKASTVRFYMGSKGDDYYCAKYLDNVSRKDNINILRLAEMYLIKAEALNELSYVADGEAFNSINAIRNRAGLSSYTSIDLTTQDHFRLAIEKERNFELIFEGNRLFDLRRTGRINEVLPDIGTLKEAGWYFPIPQSEIDTNDSID